MSVAHELYVRQEFDRQSGRFRDSVDPDDFRLTALVQHLGDPRGLRILDLGCGKGRFARRLAERGADVVGLDPSGAMIGRGEGYRAVRGSARRLPFRANSFDAVIAVEVFQHLPGVDTAIDECRRVLSPGGSFLIIDKNRAALDPRRPWVPAAFVKFVDERRGRWMYPVGAPARERWFGVGAMKRRLGRRFTEVRAVHLLSPPERSAAVFRHIPAVRRFVLWAASSPGAGG